MVWNKISKFEQNTPVTVSVPCWAKSSSNFPFWSMIEFYTILVWRQFYSNWLEYLISSIVLYLLFACFLWHSSLTCSIISSRSSVTDVTSATSVCCIASFFLIRLAAVESSYLCSITSSQLLINHSFILDILHVKLFWKNKTCFFLIIFNDIFYKSVSVTISPAAKMVVGNDNIWWC